MERTTCVKTERKDATAGASQDMLSAILKDKGLRKEDVGKLLIQHAREKQSHWLMISRYLMSCTGRDPATNACMDGIRCIHSKYYLINNNAPHATDLDWLDMGAESIKCDNLYPNQQDQMIYEILQNRQIMALLAEWK